MFCLDAEPIQMDQCFFSGENLNRKPPYFSRENIDGVSASDVPNIAAIPVIQVMDEHHHGDLGIHRLKKPVLPCSSIQWLNMAMFWINP